VDVGDKLVRINGVDVTNLALPSMIGLLDGDVDDCVLLAFERSKVKKNNHILLCLLDGTSMHSHMVAGS
jgi:hypothetical protein